MQETQTTPQPLTAPTPQTTITPVKPARQSNFELLRILCMIAIVASHLATHGGYYHVSPLSNILIKTIIIGGQLACNIFVLITGYFMINSKFKIKKLISLVCQVLFYSITIYLIMALAGRAPISYYTIKTILFPSLSGIYWFTTSYLILYILSPFINKLLHNCTQKEHKILLIILLFLSFGTRIFFQIDHFINTGWFITVYVFAAYIKLYPNKFFDSKLINIIIFVLSITSTILLNIFGIMQVFYLRNLHCFLSAYSCFNLFRTIHIKNNKFINILSSATLGVYLIHDNMHLRPWLWQTLLKCPTKALSNSFVLYAIFAIFAVYIACTIIELLRQQLFKYVTLLYSKIKVKIKTNNQK